MNEHQVYLTNEQIRVLLEALYDFDTLGRDRAIRSRLIVQLEAFRLDALTKDEVA